MSHDDASDQLSDAKQKECQVQKSVRSLPCPELAGTQVLRPLVGFLPVIIPAKGRHRAQNPAPSACIPPKSAQADWRLPSVR